MSWALYILCNHIFLLLDWHHLCFRFLSLLSTWLVILFHLPTLTETTSVTPWAADTTLCCPTYFPICVSPFILYSTSLAVPLPLIWAMQSQSDSTVKLHLPLSLMLTSQPLPFASALSDVIPLSPPLSTPWLATGNCWVFSSFPTLYLLSFLHLLWCPLPRNPLTLALLFTIFCIGNTSQRLSLPAPSFPQISLPLWISQTLTGTMGLGQVSFVILLEAPHSFPPGSFLGFASSHSLSFLNTSGFFMAVFMHSTLFYT